MTKIKLTVNNESRTVTAAPMKRLLDVLREDLQLTGVKEGCGEGECGSCSVLMNGELVNSCLVPVLQADGAQITTIEGVEQDQKLHPIQQCFLEKGGAQCGICTPGMIPRGICWISTPNRRWPRSRKGLPEIFAAAPATCASLKPFNKPPWSRRPRPCAPMFSNTL
jgi:aerobic-type carbon monoxide dehydrogenase small subunit (CoxS/CutS family)